MIAPPRNSLYLKDMPICSKSILTLVEQIGKKETEAAIRLAKRVESLETKWKRKLEIFLDKVTDNIVADLIATGRIEDDIGDFEALFNEHAFDIMFEAVESTGHLPRVPSALAKYPKGPMPNSMKKLLELWDEWRTKKKSLPRQKKIAETVKKAYIQKCQDVWRQHSMDYRKGDSYDQKEIVNKIKRSTGAEEARSKTIVETETTRYWNQSRREIYDQSEDVTHYLFVPIRDQATTKWCETRRGVIYKKGSAVLERETPPIHWNCRSEILPLTPLNPRHKALIDKKSMWRENRTPEPLPRGWNQR